MLSPFKGVCRIRATSMTSQPSLYGQAPSGLYSAQLGDGTQADLSQAIFPIVTQWQDGLFVAIGTGFFVAENGIFVTAAHVVKAVLDEQDNATGPFGIFQFLSGNHFSVRPIHRATRHLVADVAVGVATPMHHSTTGAPMPKRFSRLLQVHHRLEARYARMPTQSLTYNPASLRSYTSNPISSMARSLSIIHTDVTK